MSDMAIFHQLSTREFSFDYSDIVNLQFGNPDKISVECSVKPDAEQAANLWLGLVWLCVDGNIVGNVDDRFQEQVGIALGTLAGAARDTGKRNHPLLQGIPPREALDLVMWAVYGDEKLHPELADADCQGRSNLLLESSAVSLQ